MKLFYLLDARAKLVFILLITILVFLIDKLFVVVCLLLLLVIFRINMVVSTCVTGFERVHLSNTFLTNAQKSIVLVHKGLRSTCE